MTSSRTTPSLSSVFSKSITNHSPMVLNLGEGILICLLFIYTTMAFANLFAVQKINFFIHLSEFTSHFHHLADRVETLSSHDPNLPAFDWQMVLIPHIVLEGKCISPYCYYVFLYSSSEQHVIQNNQMNPGMMIHDEPLTLGQGPQTEDCFTV